MGRRNNPRKQFIFWRCFLFCHWTVKLTWIYPSDCQFSSSKPSNNFVLLACSLKNMCIFNPWRRTSKKPTGDITICRLYQGLRFHSQRKDGTNPTSIRPTKRNRSSNNDSLQKHQSESTFTWWRYRVLRHYSRSTTRGHASPIPLNHLPRLRA